MPWPGTDMILTEVAEERDRQDANWGEQNYPDGLDPHASAAGFELVARRDCELAFANGRGTWRHILTEEFAEANAALDEAALRTELIQVAAVAVAWVEAIDRRNRDAS